MGVGLRRWAVVAGVLLAAVAVAEVSTAANPIEPPKFAREYGSIGAAPGQVNQPYAVAVDSNGRVLVADAGNSRISVFNQSGVFLDTVGTAGGGNGQLQIPWGVDVTRDGTAFVADTYNHRVVRLPRDWTRFGTNKR